MNTPSRTPAHTLVIDIKPDGKIVGEVKGVSGPACSPLSEWLDELGEVLVDIHTTDYRKPGVVALKQTTGQ